LIVGYFLFKKRSFSHLAIWNILETGNKEDFSWQPEKAPAYFRFQPVNDKTAFFRKEIYYFIKNEKDDFRRAIKAANYISNICSIDKKNSLYLRWDSPEGMLKQIRGGGNDHCFHRAIIFSTILSSLGIKSRLWTLENDNFNATPHTIIEFYAAELKKWVFIDILKEFYALDNGSPLSFLEFRERVLKGERDSFVRNIDGGALMGKICCSGRYKTLIKTVFLRSGNDFIDKYNPKIRYGILSWCSGLFDRFPNKMRLGLSYLFGRSEFFIHYLDSYSPSLRKLIIVYKFIFYFSIFLSIFSLTAIIILLANLSKKDTFHK